MLSLIMNILLQSPGLAGRALGSVSGLGCPLPGLTPELFEPGHGDQQDHHGHGASGHR